MNAHEILTKLVVARQRHHELKAKTLRLHGSRESDRIKRKRMAAELIKSEKDLQKAELSASLYVSIHLEIENSTKKFLNKSP